MREFPKLKSGERAQYPLWRSHRRAVRTLTFLDGGEQRYAEGRQTRRWVLDLRLLSEEEAARYEEFARMYFDTLEPFSFVDPVDGREYGRCVLEGGEQWLRSEGEHRQRMRLTIAEERS